MLAKVYGPELVLDPYVMSVDALSEQDTAGQTPCAFHYLHSLWTCHQLARLPSHCTNHLAKKNVKHAHCMCMKVFSAGLLSMQDISCTLYRSFLPNLHRGVPFRFC